jgi:hypothetical protein
MVVFDVLDNAHDLRYNQMKNRFTCMEKEGE